MNGRNVCAVLLASALVWLSSVQHAAAQSDEWTSLGPAGGIISALAIDPQTPATLYAGTDSGVFKSDDSGGTWVAANSGLPTRSVRAIAIDPQTPSTLYAGTGGAGVFKSTDGGATWTSINNQRLTNAFVLALAVDPQLPATMYVGSAGAQILKSTDGGSTWSGVGPLMETKVLAIDPQVPTTLYAGTDGEIFKTFDGGATWTKTPVSGVKVWALAIDRQAPTTVYAGVSPYGSSLVGVLKTVDGGGSWTPMNDGLPGTVSALAIDPEVATILYAGTPGDGVFRSTDGAFSWTPMNEGLTNPSVRALAIDSQAFALYAATEGDGVFSRTATIEPERFTLTVSTSGLGRGRLTSSSPGIDCGPDCSEPYVTGTTVTLRARPAFGSIFIGWNGCDSVSGSSCSVTMNAERSVTANFLGVRFFIR